MNQITWLEIVLAITNLIALHINPPTRGKHKRTRKGD